MIWSWSQSAAKSFANSDALSLLTLPAHNELLTGDQLTTIALNREWRKLVTAALQYYFRKSKTALGLDNEDALDDLLTDIYTAEVLGVADNVYFAALGANQSRSNIAYAAVPGFAVSHTFSKPNAKITISNIRGSVSAGTTRGSVRGTLSAGTRLTSDSIGYINANVRDLVWSGLWEDIPLGVSHTIGLEFNANGSGSIILQAADNMVVEIEEYD